MFGVIVKAGEPDWSLEQLAVTIFTAAVTVQCFAVALETHSFTIFNHVAIWGSLLLYFGATFAYLIGRLFVRCFLPVAGLLTASKIQYRYWPRTLGLARLYFRAATCNVLVQCRSRCCGCAVAHIRVQVPAAELLPIEVSFLGVLR
jgi:hypothetical protein